VRPGPYRITFSRTRRLVRKWSKQNSVQAIGDDAFQIFGATYQEVGTVGGTAGGAAGGAAGNCATYAVGSCQR
jgi:hypothetical protein